MAAPPRFGLVCFRLAGSNNNEANKALLAAINATNAVYLTHTELAGAYTLRCAIGSTGTQQRHVDEAWAIISACVDAVLAAQASSSSADAGAAAAALVQGSNAGGR